MYQTGYVTIDKCINPEAMLSQAIYRMRYPNYEIEFSFHEQILSYLATRNSLLNTMLMDRLKVSIRMGDAERFVKLLSDWFANIAYPDATRDEHCYRMAIQGLCGFIGVYNEAEVRTSRGRIDMTLTEGDWIYIVEFKVNRTAQAALDQIKAKDYARKYEHLGKKILLMGININSETATLDTPAIERIEC